jgi:hypothetical protein
MSEDIIIQRAVAVFGMLFWFAFPIGIMISVMQQDRDAHHSPGEKKEILTSAPEIKKSA